MIYETSWRKLIRRVGRIVKLLPTEILRVGIRRRLITLGREFTVRRITMVGNRLTLIYEEDYTPNWI